MPEGKKIGGASSGGGDNLPSPVGIGLTDLPNKGKTLLGDTELRNSWVNSSADR